MTKQKVLTLILVLFVLITIGTIGSYIAFVRSQASSVSGIDTFIDTGTVPPPAPSPTPTPTPSPPPAITPTPSPSPSTSPSTAPAPSPAPSPSTSPVSPSTSPTPSLSTSPAPPASPTPTPSPSSSSSSTSSTTTPPSATTTTPPSASTSTNPSTTPTITIKPNTSPAMREELVKAQVAKTLKLLRNTTTTTDAATVKVVFNTALPFAETTVTLKSDPQRYSVQADATGAVLVVAKDPLPIGKHTVTVDVVDPNSGKIYSVSSLFTIEKAHAATSLHDSTILKDYQNPLAKKYFAFLLGVMALALIITSVSYWRNMSDETPFPKERG